MQENKIDYSLVSCLRAQKLMVFRLALARTGDLKKTLSLQEEIGLALGVESPRVARNKSYVDVEVPLPVQYRTTLAVERMVRRGGTKIAVGQTPTGQQVNLNLSEPRACQALIAGTTGSGKTVLLRLITWSLIIGNPERNARFILVDGKGGRAFAGFERVPHLLNPVITEPGAAVRALAWAVSELNRRKVSGQNTPRIFIIVDEVRELLDLAGEDLVNLVTPLASMGRELGIHLVFATQKPLSDSVGSSLVKANLVLRMSGVVTDSNEAYLVTGRKQSGAELLQGEGDFLINAPGVLNPVRLQVALITDAQIARTMPRIEERGDDFGLDLDIDPGLVSGLNGNGCAPAVDVEQLAVALAVDEGINKLQRRFGIGGEKATELRNMVTAMRGIWDKLGYNLGYSPIPHSDGALSAAD